MCASHVAIWLLLTSLEANSISLTVFFFFFSFTTFCRVISYVESICSKSIMNNRYESHRNVPLNSKRKKKMCVREKKRDGKYCLPFVCNREITMRSLICMPSIKNVSMSASQRLARSSTTKTTTFGRLFVLLLRTKRREKQLVIFVRWQKRMLHENDKLNGKEKSHSRHFMPINANRNTKWEEGKRSNIKMQFHNIKLRIDDDASIRLHVVVVIVAFKLSARVHTHDQFKSSVVSVDVFEKRIQTRCKKKKENCFREKKTFWIFLFALFFHKYLCLKIGSTYNGKYRIDCSGIVAFWYFIIFISVWVFIIDLIMVKLNTHSMFHLSEIWRDILYKMNFSKGVKRSQSTRSSISSIHLNNKNGTQNEHEMSKQNFTIQNILFSASFFFWCRSKVIWMHMIRP